MRPLIRVYDKTLLIPKEKNMVGTVITAGIDKLSW